MTTRQKPWDKYEAVLLLDGYLDIIKNGTPQSEVIERISHELRTMAINRGYCIDDIFRNKNGITFQIKSMESAYLGYTVIKPATKLFTETVSLYKCNPDEYEELVKEARSMIAGTNNVEKKFMHYLASQIPSTILSELSTCYSDIEAFCTGLKVLNKPLFETTDIETISKVQKTIKQNKIFKITRRKNYSKIVLACRYYYEYVCDGLYESTGSDKEAPLSTVNELCASDSIDTAVQENCKPEENCALSNPIVQTEASQNLEDMVRNALRSETEGNNFGTTISFLQGQVRGADRMRIKAILDSADWAKFQFGRYYYVDIKEHRAEIVEETPPQHTQDISEMSLEQTEQDKRLMQRYPIIYKRLFNALFEITETNAEGATVSDLYKHISCIGRSSTIEDILDNVSWAVSNGDRYIFSKEVVDNAPPLDDAGVSEVSSDVVIASGVPQNDYLCVNFCGTNELAYTKPFSLSYFGEEKVAYTSWTDLYVSFVATICEDYPHVFKSGMSFSKNKGRIELTNNGSANSMIDPKPIPGTDYLLETNLSADHIISKIKYILDLCNVDYDNVVIKFKKKDAVAPTSQKDAGAMAITTTMSPPVREVNFDSFMNYLSHALNMAERTAYNYARAIGICENIAKAQNFPNYHLFSEDVDTVLRTIQQLKSDPDFINLNKNRHNQLSAALAKLSLFLSGERPPVVEGTGVSERILREKTVPFKNEEYEKVLKNNFKKGFRLESPLEIRKFRRYFNTCHNAELADSDEVISNTIKQLCIIYDGKAYLPAVMLSDELKEKLLQYIEDSFANGKTAIYFQAIYTEFADEFLDYHIHDAEMLKAYLTYVAEGSYYINRNSISKEANATLDPLSEIRSCLQGYGRPVEYNELFAALPHLPQNKVKFILASNGEFVNNGHGAYFHESVVDLSEESLENIAAIISNTIEEKDFMGGNELYDAIKAKYPYIIEENQVFSVYGFRDALKYKLGDKFSFKGNIISRAGQELSMADVFANYARHHDSFTLAELQALASDLASVIYFDSVYENSLRISKEQFVAKNHAQFVVADTDAAIDRVCTGNYIPIQDVTNFGIFPYAGFPWNSYLLEHYVADYSRKYMLLHSNYNGTECAGAIVKRSAGIDSFDELIVDILSNSEVELKKAPVLQLLSDCGYLARRRYSSIESLIIKASAQRNRKDTD